MKNLANCKPSEFLRQTVKIKKSVEKWLKLTDIMNIRRRKPDIPEGATREEKATALREQARENAMAMFETVFEEHPEETLEVLALMCFVEPENVDDHSVGEYLKAFTELINDESVMDFFTSLARLGLKATPKQ